MLTVATAIRSDRFFSFSIPRPGRELAERRALRKLPGMTNRIRESWDALILGSGFAGSLTAWILAKQGWRVLIVDPGCHPRFAVGESSTPTADFLLADLAHRWGLRELAPLATWGSWKRAYPELVCGKKRGFSYYSHTPGQAFADDAEHSRSLLVAASREDSLSDTHWLRSSVDAFIAGQAVRAGVELREQSQLIRASFEPRERRWDGIVVSADGREPLRAKWLIDASGGATATAAWVNNPADQVWMRTRTRARFAHFTGVKPFAPEICAAAGFSGDDAAQHHLIDDGWVWMLRMDNGTTSVGVVEKLATPREQRSIGATAVPGATGVGDDPAADSWERLRAYPGIAAMLSEAQRITPAAGLVSTGRISRCRSRASGPGWVLLPAAYGLVDPLHSTGIAHSLSGVARVVEILLGDSSRIPQRLAGYDRDLRSEIRWIDTLVAGCYRALPSFSRFVAFASYYFVSAIEFEAAMAQDPRHWPRGFLECGNRALLEAAEGSWRQVGNAAIDERRFVESVRARIEPWNRVGLLDPARKNRFAHTAAPKYAAWVE